LPKDSFGSSKAAPGRPCQFHECSIPGAVNVEAESPIFSICFLFCCHKDFSPPRESSCDAFRLRVVFVLSRASPSTESGPFGLAPDRVSASTGTGKICFLVMIAVLLFHSIVSTARKII